MNYNKNEQTAEREEILQLKKNSRRYEEKIEKKKEKKEKKERERDKGNIC